MNAANLVSTSDISRTLGVNVSIKFLADLGFQPVVKIHSGTYWNRCDVTPIAYALASRLARIGSEQQT